MFSPYTDPRSIAICNEYIEIYNENPTPENFQKKKEENLVKNIKKY